MHVLLTGVSSFLGRHLAEHFVHAGLRVTGTYRGDYPWLEQLRQHGRALELVRLDLANENAFTALPSAIDAVVHVAALSTMPGVSIDGMLGCNVTGTRNVQRYALAAGATRLIYASSLSVHGQIAGPVIDETTPVIDPDLYGSSKYLGERLLACRAC
jgi:nucleoside-diphosphate-sugar epimerase